MLIFQGVPPTKVPNYVITLDEHGPYEETSCWLSNNSLFLIALISFWNGRIRDVAKVVPKKNKQSYK